MSKKNVIGFKILFVGLLDPLGDRLMQLPALGEEHQVVGHFLRQGMFEDVGQVRRFGFDQRQAQAS